MKKSIIAASLASLFSLPALAQNDIQNPVWVDAVNPIEQTPTQPVLPGQPTLPDASHPIELPKPTQPIEQTPTQPVLPVQPTLPDASHPIELPKPTQPIEQTPTQPVLPEHPTLPEPSNPIELPKPTQPIEQTPTQPQLPVQPTLPEPTQPPVDNSPERPQPTTPSNPIEGDDIDVPDISGPTEAERSSDLELGFQAMAEEYNQKFNEHQEQMDGIRASIHAVTNARPFVTNGEFAIGAGVGFAGSKEALALGGAYGINEKLSVSGTLNYETSGKYSSSDVSGGVGIQYNFK
ncbi:YadA-like family protein [Vibrio gallaecicus]|uniref:YadA C-terminal domain-containing protein n=1 Tax=Vibrio gallaecicus TaxID=552386 RepID=UPI0010C94AD3|nr:YadA C-terminal domain-containing protein [Vibrio gallaecicus]MDN3614183.1 YadA-like family protein [Vibrio gallaecicus]